VPVPIILSAVVKSLLAISCGVLPYCVAATRAATPETYGVAMDVPERNIYGVAVL